MKEFLKSSMTIGSGHSVPMHLSLYTLSYLKQSISIHRIGQYTVVIWLEEYTYRLFQAVAGLHSICIIHVTLSDSRRCHSWLRNIDTVMSNYKPATNYSLNRWFLGFPTLCGHRPIFRWLLNEHESLLTFVCIYTMLYSCNHDSLNRKKNIHILP